MKNSCMWIGYTAAVSITLGSLACPPQVDFDDGPFVNNVDIFDTGDESTNLQLGNFFGDPTKPFSFVVANRAQDETPGESGRIAIRLSADGLNWSGTTTYVDPMSSAITPSITGLVTADLNGDLVDDLIAVNQGNPPALFVMIHDPLVIPNPNDPFSGNAGTFTSIYPSGSFVGNEPISVAAGDLNGDGHIDVVTSSVSDSRVEILINANAADPFPPQNRSSVFVTGIPRQVAIAEMTGDSHLDIVVLNRLVDEGTFVILEGDGSGSFTALDPHPTADANQPRMKIADMDGDSDNDVVVYFEEAGVPDAFLFLNDGTAGDFELGVFLLEADFSEIAIADIDNNGALDIVAALALSPGVIRVALNNGAAQFTLNSLDFDLGTGGPFPNSIQAADFDQDGFVDLAIAAFGTTPSVVANVIRLDNVTSNLVIGDLNGDAQVNGTDLAILLASWGPCRVECCPADLDCDGDIDGADLATLLSNWTDTENPPQLPSSASDGSDAGDLQLFKEGPSASATTNDVPWILAELGFSSIESYVYWISTLNSQQLFEHVADVISLILNQE